MAQQRRPGERPAAYPRFLRRARRAALAGEHKSDPKDARVIADQVRMLDDLRPVTAMRDEDANLNR